MLCIGSPTQNRLREALVLYHSIITSTYFREIPVILFLNKADLLRRKCRSGDSAQLITAYFPEFAIAPNPGGREADPADWKQVFRFIERMFLESHLGPDVKDEKTRQKQIYAHMVRACGACILILALALDSPCPEDEGCTDGTESESKSEG